MKEESWQVSEEKGSHRQFTRRRVGRWGRCTTTEVEGSIKKEKKRDLVQKTFLGKALSI